MSFPLLGFVHGHSFVIFLLFYIFVSGRKMAIVRKQSSWLPVHKYFLKAPLATKVLIFHFNWWIVLLLSTFYSYLYKMVYLCKSYKALPMNALLVI